MRYEWTALGSEDAFILVVLTTTVRHSRDRVRVVLNGQLTGEWVDCLARAVAECSPGAEMEIDLDSITRVDRIGEQALLALWQARRRFICTSIFARALCEGLGIPIEEGAR